LTLIFCLFLHFTAWIFCGAFKAVLPQSVL
jgi:hypothetical protein